MKTPPIIPTPAPITKTMKQKLGATAKYAGTSLSLGFATTQIIVFAFPQLKPISEAIQALLCFAINLALVKFKLVNE